MLLKRYMFCWFILQKPLQAFAFHQLKWRVSYSYLDISSMCYIVTCLICIELSSHSLHLLIHLRSIDINRMDNEILCNFLERMEVDLVSAQNSHTVVARCIIHCILESNICNNLQSLCFTKNHNFWHIETPQIYNSTCFKPKEVFLLKEKHISKRSFREKTFVFVTKHWDSYVWDRWWSVK